MQGFSVLAALSVRSAASLVGFSIYPQVGFIREVKLGIMSSETYETREKYDCCCA